MLCAKGVIAQKMAPDFTLTDIEGVEISLSDYRGKVVLLDFFSTWCGTCIAEMPHLKSLNEEFGEDLVLISISVTPDFDSVEKLQEFKQEQEIDWIIVRDTIGINDEYSVQYLPTLIIIDQDGYIQHKHVGLTDDLFLHIEIDEIIPEFGIWISKIFLLLTFAVILAIYKMRPRKQISKTP